MSDASESVGDFASALEGLDISGNTEVAPVVEGNPDPVVEAPKLSAFAQEYLNGVDDAERELAAKHVQQWDKGFQKYAQRVTEKYAPYDQLGTFEDIQRAHSIAQMFSSDPHAVTAWMIEQGYGPQTQAPVTQPGAAPPEDPYAGLPDAVKLKLQEIDTLKQQGSRYETALGAMYQRLQQDEQEKATATELQRIETGFAEAKLPKEHELLVLNLMKGGMEMDAAIQAINGSIQSGINQTRSPQAPRVLSASSLPPQSKSVNEMTTDERRAGFVAMLEGAIK